ncbi:CU044_2847 family protein [Nonomuraea sp. PA05]|uniref:CU044_2847 family protein n=1 Tax=Nonomuraea sp. PA05 TaxID=2604466 RepID=UPI001651C77D|nr:CU044_2847 family protein [Nonomuraea sp. PA05]
MTKPAKGTGDSYLEILVEVQPPLASGDLAPRLAIPEDFRKRAGDIAASVAEIADQFRSKLESVVQPSKHTWNIESLEIGFDIAIQAETGVVIAKATTGATFSARMTLKTKQSQA